MKVVALFSLVLVLVTSVHAADPPELEKLRASYKAAVSKATKPIMEAHVTALEKLRDNYARASNLAGANKAQADIDRAKVSMSVGELNPPAADANNVTSSELDKLRAAHDADIERAIKPLGETYVRELDKLRDGYTRATNLTAANAVDAELTAIKSGGASKGKAEPQAEGKPSAFSGKAPKSEWYVGKTWGNADTAWTFAKGGGGEVKHHTGKTTPLTWEVMPTGVLKLRHEMSSKKDVGTVYMYFTSREAGMFGTDGPERLNKALHLKK